ncbi:GAG-pre-integrase domain-containing protein, partial [Pseudomonas syringae]|uniref:GAG-pre-integrase domain-containing protein n=1 Tax=Pseudomonas syringae TaxID=317 RepID=UPI0034D3E136
GRQRGGLYYLTKPNSSCTTSPSSSYVNSISWHRRLGHPSPQHLHLLAKQSLDVSSHLNKPCDVCPLAKQTRLPFPLSHIASKHIFELV